MATLRRDTQEGLDPLMQAVDGLDVQFATYPLASRLVHYLVRDLHPDSTARQGRATVGNQQGVLLGPRTGSSTALMGLLGCPPAGRR